MISNLKKLNDHQIKVMVELDQEDLQKYIDEAESILASNLEIKGFRPGKAPKELVRKHIDKEKVKALALEIAVEKSMSEVTKENSLDILDTSHLSVEKNDTAQLKYSVVVGLFPSVELADLSKIKVKKRDVGVENKEIEDALEVIKNSRATLTDKGDNEPANKSDRVEVDFEVKKDGQIIEGGVSKNHPLIIGGRNFIPGFEDQLIGMKKGESRSFSLVAPEDYFYKDIAGKKLDFNVKLNDVKKVTTSEFGDDFARSLGRFADMGKLRKSVKEGLTQEKKIKESQRMRLEILDNVVSRSKIEVPDDLLNKQLDIMITDFDHSLHEKGLELSLYLAKINKTQEELKKDWTKDAEKQVKISLILRKLAKDLKLEATREEVEEMAGQVIQSAIAEGGIGQDEIDLDKIKESMAVKIMNEKALEYLESNCVV